MSFSRHEQTIESLSPERRRELLSEGVCSLKKAKEFTSLGRTKIYELMATGELPYVKIGGARRIPIRALRELLERHLVASD